jgi:hypothetical protein
VILVFVVGCTPRPALSRLMGGGGARPMRLGA